MMAVTTRTHAAATTQRVRPNATASRTSPPRTKVISRTVSIGDGVSSQPNQPTSRGTSGSSVRGTRASAASAREVLGGKDRVLLRQRADALYPHQLSDRTHCDHRAQSRIPFDCHKRISPCRPQTNVRVMRIRPSQRGPSWRARRQHRRRAPACRMRRPLIAASVSIADEDYAGSPECEAGDDLHTARIHRRAEEQHHRCESDQKADDAQPGPGTLPQAGTAEATSAAISATPARRMTANASGPGAQGRDTRPTTA